VPARLNIDKDTQKEADPMSDTGKESARQAEDVVTMIGREIAAMQGALLALTSIVARHGDATAITSHLLAIRESAAKETNSAHFTDLLDKMIDVAKPAVH
jgi:hypothetical protein